MTPGSEANGDRQVGAVAAVLHDKGGAFVLQDVIVGPIRADEVLVRIVASGICHTDLGVRQQRMPVPLPAVLGHEGAGIVEAVGAAIHSVAIGDPVVLSFMSCGACPECRTAHSASCAELGRLCFTHTRPDGSHALHDMAGDPVGDRFFGQSSFATYAVANERNVVRVPAGIPLEILAPLGCGVLTGAGAVWNELEVRPGGSFAVFGAGAVGLSALMAAKVAGAETLVAVDLVPERLALARELGATHVLHSAEVPDVAAAIRAMTGDGVDFALDTTGVGSVIENAFAALRQRGSLGLVACANRQQWLSIPHFALLGGCRRVIGIIEGGGSAQATIARMIELHQAGRFPFDRLIRHYPLEAINQAVHDCETGETIKPVLVMDNARAGAPGA